LGIYRWLKHGRREICIETLIQENKEWRALYHELLQVHQALTGTELEQPSLRFTKNVMEEIAGTRLHRLQKPTSTIKLSGALQPFLFFPLLGSSYMVSGRSTGPFRAKPKAR
jgi:hypothetical protein